MPGPRECALCGGIHRDYGQRHCRQCRLREYQCPVCDRIHFSDRRKCGACSRATIGLDRLIGHRLAKRGTTQMRKRRVRIERDAERDDHQYRGPGGLRVQRLAKQREHGIRLCARCQREHHDQQRALCRQCRLVGHESCADCSKPFQGEPSATVCATCRSRQKRARRRAKVELSYFDATGDLDSGSRRMV